jgi:hypothetical protein
MSGKKGGTTQTAPGDDSNESAHDPRTEFFKQYEEEAKAYDDQFEKKYDNDLNITLIFVSVFLV